MLTVKDLTDSVFLQIFLADMCFSRSPCSLVVVAFSVVQYEKPIRDRPEEKACDRDPGVRCF
jgi:hypothetical protein